MTIMTVMTRLLLASLMFGSVANAADVDLQVDARVPPNQSPKLTLNVHKDVALAVIKVNAGKAQLTQKKGPAAAESSIVFELPHSSAGVLNWKGTLTVTFGDGSEGTLPLSFATEVLSANFSFRTVHSREDLRKERMVKITSSRPVGKLAIEVYGESDELLASTAVPFDPPIPIGDIATATWIPVNDHEPLRVHVDVYDDKGAFRGVDSFPYDIEIPHVDVEFETGKSWVRTSEEPKLQAAIPEVDTALRKYGAALKVQGVSVKLFVAGHTDSVGNDGTNRTLSNARAMAIAQWFKRHGITIPIYARGFGEDQLRVATEDNVDNAQNRRVEYNVGVDGPTGSTTGWNRVQ
jgi:outer membrane protein OmpA-like peptidoglycan-associated protein